jgi:centromere-binding protein SoPB
MSEAAASITVRVPLTIRRQVGRKTVMMPSAEHSPAAVTSRSDPVLVKALARAFRYQRLLDDGRYGSISEMAEAERIDRGYLGRILQLTLLPPDIVQAVIDGSQPAELGLSRLLESLSTEWEQQRRRL